MTADIASTMSPPPLLCARWGLTNPRFLSHRANAHWRVDSRRGPAVLRRYGPDVNESDIEYEVRFSDQLATAGWPVPPMFEPPARWEDRWWAVFGLLPGEQRTGPGEDRRRGRLLAELHTTTRTFPAVERSGMPPVRDVVLDPRLGDALRFVERHFPEHGRILRWHHATAVHRFAAVTDPVLATTIHGDFNSRNLLFTGDHLSGILDFEGSHWDARIADFALAWRGKRDEVVLGYDEVAPLSDTEWHLLTPCMWAWAFYGVADLVDRMRCGAIPPIGFDWQVNMLLRRSPLMGPNAIPYPHNEG